MSFSKKLSEIKVGIAISTFTNNKTDFKRYEIIDKSLQSLQKIISQSKLNIYVIIVVDGTVPDIHKELLLKYNFYIFKRTPHYRLNFCLKGVKLIFSFKYCFFVGEVF